MFYNGGVSISLEFVWFVLAGLFFGLEAGGVALATLKRKDL